MWQHDNPANVSSISWPGRVSTCPPLLPLIAARRITRSGTGADPVQAARYIRHAPLHLATASDMRGSFTRRLVDGYSTHSQHMRHNMQNGWLCPACKKAHAPDVKTCPEPLPLAGFTYEPSDPTRTGQAYPATSPYRVECGSIKCTAYPDAKAWSG